MSFCNCTKYHLYWFISNAQSVCKCGSTQVVDQVNQILYNQAFALKTLDPNFFIYNLLLSHRSTIKLLSSHWNRYCVSQENLPYIHYMLIPLITDTCSTSKHKKLLAHNLQSPRKSFNKLRMIQTGKRWQEKKTKVSRVIFNLPWIANEIFFPVVDRFLFLSTTCRIKLILEYFISILV